MSDATVRGIKDTSAEGNRYHNRRYVALAAELGLRGPERPENVIGWSDCRVTGETAANNGVAVVLAENRMVVPAASPDITSDSATIRS